MTQTDATQLIECFQSEITLLQSLIDVVLQEKDLLVQRDYAALETIAEQKETLSKQLEQRTKERLRILDIGQQPTQASQHLQRFLGGCSEAEQAKISQLNEQLAELLLRCREQNTINGQVISANIHLRQDILNSLSGKQNQEATNRYTATGNIAQDHSSSRHQKA